MIDNAVVLDVIALARELQAAGRCRGPMATRRTEWGSDWWCSPTDPGANRFCTIGALYCAVAEIAFRIEGSVPPVNRWSPCDDRPELTQLGKEIVDALVPLLSDAFRGRRDAKKYYTLHHINDAAGVPLKRVLNLWDQAARLVDK